MPEKKRPAFNVRPLPSDVVWMNASSIDTELSGASATVALPLSHGSMFAANDSSVSERVKPRLPSPASASGGSGNPVMV